MLDVDLHGWTPVRARGKGWRQYTPSSNATTLESKKSVVENTPMRVCGHACGGPDGARHAANDLPRRLSRLRPEPSLAGPRPHRRAGPHAVPDGRTGRSYPGVSGRPCRPCLVQLVPPPVLSAMRVSP